VRLFLRVSNAINDALREKLRYRGDVSRLINTALMETNLKTVVLTDCRPDRSAQFVARVDPKTDKSVRETAEKRGCTVSALANSALEKWLASHRD